VGASVTICRYTLNLPIAVRIDLINRKCVPILMYGLCGGVSNKDRQRLHVVYRNAFRSLFQLGRYSPISEVMFYCGIVSFNLLYDKAVIFLYRRIMQGIDKFIFNKNLDVLNWWRHAHIFLE
jgi:hypothetical protein